MKDDDSTNVLETKLKDSHVSDGVLSSGRELLGKKGIST